MRKIPRELIPLLEGRLASAHGYAISWNELRCGSSESGRTPAVVDFDQPVTGRVLKPCEDRRVDARGQGDGDRRFEVVARRQAGVGHGGGVVRIILPVVVCVEKRSISVV